MNEQIRKLATEAGLQPFEDCGPGYVYRMEKFADLIIRDCVKIIEPTEEHRQQPHRYLGEEEGIQLLEEQIYFIKKHFGIES